MPKTYMCPKCGFDLKYYGLSLSGHGRYVCVGSKTNCGTKFEIKEIEEEED